jgi:hypothetical protein
MHGNSWIIKTDFNENMCLVINLDLRPGLKLVKELIMELSLLIDKARDITR